MKRIIAFDYGTSRIGVAISDPLRITAQPLCTIDVREEGMLPDKVKTIMCDMDIEKAVVGLPLHMTGDEGELAVKARQFAQMLEQEFNISVQLWDERLSSRLADRVMLESDMRRDKRKKRRDVIAAVIILQNYLDFLSS
ncbi:MAG: Holliday junction resolvase RuvX [bacterium]